MIVIKNLSKTYQNSSGDALALDNISLTVPDAQTMALLGPSGSGKTTLLRCILGLETSDEGSIIFPPLNSQHQTHKGMVFQNFHLFPHLSVLENISLALIQVLKETPASAISHSMKLLNDFDIASLANRYPNSLSGGQQQRVAIVRALALRPQLMLFDEPTSALDPERRQQVTELFKELNQKGVSILVVTHDYVFAKEASQWVAFLEKGILTATQATPAFFAAPFIPEGDL